MLQPLLQLRGYDGAERTRAGEKGEWRGMGSRSYDEAYGMFLDDERARWASVWASVFWSSFVGAGWSGADARSAARRASAAPTPTCCGSATPRGWGGSGAAAAGGRACSLAPSASAAGAAHGHGWVSGTGVGPDAQV